MVSGICVLLLWSVDLVEWKQGSGLRGIKFLQGELLSVLMSVCLFFHPLRPGCALEMPDLCTQRPDLGCLGLNLLVSDSGLQRPGSGPQGLAKASWLGPPRAWLGPPKACPGPPSAWLGPSKAWLGPLKAWFGLLGPGMGHPRTGLGLSRPSLDLSGPGLSHPEPRLGLPGPSLGFPGPGSGHPGPGLGLAGPSLGIPGVRA